MNEQGPKQETQEASVDINNYLSMGTEELGTLRDTLNSRIDKIKELQQGTAGSDPANLTQFRVLNQEKTKAEAKLEQVKDALRKKLEDSDHFEERRVVG